MLQIRLCIDYRLGGVDDTVGCRLGGVDYR